MPAALIRRGAVLTLDAALDGCVAGLVVDGQVVAEETRAGVHGSAAELPALAAAVLREAGLPGGIEGLGGVAVTVGPGSFTGVRAALALAHGIGLGAGVAVVGVSVGDAIRAGVGAGAGRRLWVAVDGRRGRVFLDRGGGAVLVGLEDLPSPCWAVEVAGSGAAAVVARLAAVGHVARLSDAGLCARGIAAGAGAHPRLAAALYVEAVAARVQEARRPAPAG